MCEKRGKLEKFNATVSNNMGLQNVAQKAKLSSSLNIFFLSNRANLGFNK